MASIFRRDDDYVDKPNRNTVDFTFQNNLTTDFGSLRPCMCIPVIPGDSYEFEPTFGLKFLPMVFPVQTRMKASIHYFYVRNRNLWKDWPDFIGKTKDGLIPPYIHLTDNNRKMVETCQLGDFLGIPTRVYGSTRYQHDIILSVDTLDSIVYFTPTQLSAFIAANPIGNFIDMYVTGVSSDIEINGYFLFLSPLTLGSDFINNAVDNIFQFNFSFSGPFQQNWTSDNHIVLLLDNTGSVVQRYYVPVNSDVHFKYHVDINVENLDSAGQYSIIVVPVANISLGQAKDTTVYGGYGDSLDEFDVKDLELSQLPWRSDGNPSGIPLSALPFRAYESIYNSFYRNAENNPLLIDGVPEYNKWLRTTEGGPDTNMYNIMYHNWEDDFLTTAVPSPQQGNAPLVGLSGTPTLTIAHDDGTTTTMNLEVNEDGTVVSANPQSGDAVTQQALIETVSYGISINDFRNVNSFQRWLENNIRRGYKYRDQIKTHYGVTVRYDELDMPEFIGGATENVLVNQISQTVPTETSPLGDVAGQASAIGQGERITHYCDEHGFIIGILCVKPVANYSQLLPKYFNVTDTFDYYFPEFGHIGMQPITYAEVTPLQAHLEGKLNDVFGYQRAWYDLIAKTDEVHGLFRSDFRNFLINRTFEGIPELGASFTVMDPNQLNDVFAYTDKSDKILGQIYTKISKKTPIPLYGIPKLE